MYSNKNFVQKLPVGRYGIKCVTAIWRPTEVRIACQTFNIIMKRSHFFQLTTYKEDNEIQTLDKRSSGGFVRGFQILNLFCVGHVCVHCLTETRLKHFTPYNVIKGVSFIKVMSFFIFSLIKPQQVCLLIIGQKGINFFL